MLPSTLDMVPSPSTWNPRPLTLDKKIDNLFKKNWKKNVTLDPRHGTLALHVEPSTLDRKIDSLHAFGDASTQGVGTTVYAVIQQSSGPIQRLVAARGRLAKQGLTVPRLELISAHMATNLVINLKNALNDLPSPRVYAWLDSTVALHWIGGNGEYKQFVSNRVEKIHQRPEIEWRHVPTHDNPADLASRGGGITSLWLNGPEWLSNKENWPPNPVTSASAATEEEAKVIREVLKSDSA